MSEIESHQIELDPKKLATIDQIIDFIAKRDLVMVAVLFIESVKPMHRIGAHLLTFCEPFLNMLVNAEQISLFRDALEDQRYVNYLLDKLEELND